MLSEAPLRFACAIKAWYHLTLHVQHLGLRVGPETGERIVDDGRRPRREKRGLLDLVPWGRLLEVCIDACVHEGVVPGDRFLQDGGWHRACLIGVGNPTSDVRNRVSAEEVLGI